MNGARIIDSSTLIGELRERGLDRRSLTAVAGPPGAGKTTLADEVASRLNGTEAGCAAVLSADGYHYDDLVLGPKGWLARKGAPHTFDVTGFASMLERIRANVEPEIAVPVFDRGIEIARGGARLIPRTVRHVIVEGNYLLLELPPWDALAVFFETTVFLDVPRQTHVARLRDRWKDLSPADRDRKLNENDIPKADLVTTRSRTPEFVLRVS